MSSPAPPSRMSFPDPASKVSSPAPPFRVSLPPLPVNVLAPLFPFNLFAESLPVASISEDPVSVRFSTSLERVKVAEECTASVPDAESSVMESLVLSTK